MTLHLFYEHSYQKEEANTPIIAIDQELHGIVIAKSLFFARSGGQPGDKGIVFSADGKVIPVLDTIKAPKTPEMCCLLLSPESALPPQGTTIKQAIDWSFRYPVMQMHTALHLLCASLPFGITGGNITPSKSRLDFATTGEHLPDKLEIARRVNQLIKKDLPIESLWVERSFLDKNPDIIRTLKVQPPQNSQRLRMIRIGSLDSPIDLQPCGGTHVRSTAEIPAIEVRKVENKGQQNKRISIQFKTS